MDVSAFLAIALACAPQVHANTAQALVSVESAFNPWAIGVVGGVLVRQPRHRAEALATAKALPAGTSASASDRSTSATSNGSG
jgi:type IV secretion system protein VirB1